MLKWLIMKNKAIHSQVTESNLGSDVISVHLLCKKRIPNESVKIFRKSVI